MTPPRRPVGLDLGCRPRVLDYGNTSTGETAEAVHIQVHGAEVHESPVNRRYVTALTHLLACSNTPRWFLELNCAARRPRLGAPRALVDGAA